MISLPSARKRADEFEALLTRPDGPGSADLAELVTVASALREHAPASPRPDFTLALREQLLTEAATVLTKGSQSLVLPIRRRGPRERRLVAAATAMVFVGGTAGMAAASQNALPGDALYPIKRTLERAQAGLNTDDAGKGRDLLDQANDRLQEVRSLLAKRGGSARVPGTLHDFSVQAQEGTNLLAHSFEENRDPAKIAAVRSFAATSLKTLQELAKTAPPQAQTALAEAAMILAAIDQQMLSLCTACASDLPPLQLTDFLSTSAGLKEAQEAAALADGSSATAGQPSTAPDGSTGPSKSGPAKAPSKPETPIETPAPDATVKETKKGLSQTVDNTVTPLDELLDDVLPGADKVLDDLTGGLGGG